LSQGFAGLDHWAAQTQLGESGNDDYDKFSLPTGSGFTEDILKMRARGLVSDFSCDETKC
jgi:hypothetical protein